MKIIMISYGDYLYDGRLRELYEVAKNLGDVIFISRKSDNKPIDKNHFIFSGNNYCTFLLYVTKTIMKFNNIDIIFADNRKSIIPMFLCRIKYRKSISILDCRELYLKKESQSLVSRFGCDVEKKGIQKADLIIVANQYRSEFMKDYYKLPYFPLVFENYRKLEYSETYIKKEIQERIDKETKDSSIFYIISTSGCLISRTNDQLVIALNRLTFPIKLFLVGSSTINDKKFIDKIVESNKLHDKVVIFDQLNQSELCYLIRKCNAGVVNYHQKDVNNKYCASGKIYEFIYEGIPVITTPNPPLVQMCEKYRIGVYGDDYALSIEKLRNNYEEYRYNVIQFNERYKVRDNNEKLIRNLEKSIKTNHKVKNYD